MLDQAPSLPSDTCVHEVAKEYMGTHTQQCPTLKLGRKNMIALSS